MEDDPVFHPESDTTVRRHYIHCEMSDSSTGDSIGTSCVLTGANVWDVLCALLRCKGQGQAQSSEALSPLCAHL